MSTETQNQTEHETPGREASECGELLATPAIRELAHNIRRNLNKMHRLMEPGNDRDSALIDLINHTETLAQQVETECS